MDKKTSDVYDESDKVTEIITKIRENVRGRQKSEDMKLNFLSECNRETGSQFNRDLQFINSHWDIHNTSYFISSHHPHIGKFLVKGRRLVHGEVRRYVDPMVSLQSDLNLRAIRILTQISQTCERLDQTLHEDEVAVLERERELVQSLSEDIGILNQKVEKLQENVDDQVLQIISLKKELHNQVLQTISIMDKDIQNRLRLSHALEKRVLKAISEEPGISDNTQNTTTNYFLFENRFRGSREDIKQRQLSFLHFFEGCGCVLDIGCGRGEFLETLRENGIGAKGIDIDSDMVEYCRSFELNVERADAISYLEKQDDNSLDGIFMDQLVEHLDSGYLIRLLALCQRKLKHNSYLVIETVNPLSFVSFVNFYIDLTHTRPVHPETLQYLLTAAGFPEGEKKFFSEVPADQKLKKISEISSISGDDIHNFEVYNYNIDILNGVLFGAQDYAIIVRK
jgi:SAM-dependent methyltransferase